jgi:hypothetical protein
MNTFYNQAVYRVRKFYRKGDVAKKYQYTYEIIDDTTQQVMAVCDLIGKAAFNTLTILDHQHKTWEMKPNRNIMPSRWIVTDPGQGRVVQFDQKNLR